MLLRWSCLVAFALVGAVGCKSGSDEAFCAAQKSAFMKRCVDGCAAQQITQSARAACEPQCVAALPLDAQYAARCMPAGAAASAAPSK